MAEFDIDPCLSGDKLTLSPMVESDRDGLFKAASDPEIWAQHPANTRHERAVFDAYFDFLLSSGGTLVARDGDQIIGCSRYYPVPDHPGEYGIGFTFLARSHWGGDWNKEMKFLMLQHAFATFERVWFHIAPENRRSQIATTRLGAQFQYDAELDLGSGASPNKCYLMTPASWEQATGWALS